MIPITKEIKKTIIEAIDTKLKMVSSAMDSDGYVEDDFGKLMSLGGELQLAKLAVEQMESLNKDKQRGNRNRLI